jgi:hypothetical protein
VEYIGNLSAGSLNTKFMCMRLVKCDKGEVHRPLSNFAPHTHTLYILRHFIDIVFIRGLALVVCSVSRRYTGFKTRFRVVMSFTISAFSGSSLPSSYL